MAFSLGAFLLKGLNDRLIIVDGIFQWKFNEWEDGKWVRKLGALPEPVEGMVQFGGLGIGSLR